MVQGGKGMEKETSNSRGPGLWPACALHFLTTCPRTLDLLSQPPQLHHLIPRNKSLKIPGSASLIES